MDQFLDLGKVELRISSVLLEQMVQHVMQLVPEEACGLLAGADREVLKVYPVTNILHSPVRYRMDPAEQLKVFMEIDQSGWELVGIYHSHPGGPDHPSITDLREAYYPEAVFLILSPAGETWRFRGYRIRDGMAREVVVRIDHPAEG